MKKAWTVDGELYTLEEGYKVWEASKKKREVRMGYINSRGQHVTCSSGSTLDILDEEYGAVVKPGQSRLTVTEKIAGSNPVSSAKKEDYGYEYIGSCVGA